MYFNYKKSIDITKIINKNYLILAHTKEDNIETLKNHTKLALEYFSKIIKTKNLKSVFSKIEEEFLQDYPTEHIELFKEMIVNTITLHDIGKVNAYFQKNRLNNDLGIRGCGKYKNSHHSILSAIIYIDYYFSIIKNIKKPNRDQLLDFMMLNAYIITRHHGDLTSWETFKKKFKEDEEGFKLLTEQFILYNQTLNKKIEVKLSYIYKIFDILNKWEKQYSNEQRSYRYIYERFMLSMLTACDFYATTEFINDVKIKDFGIIDDVEEFYSIYIKGEINKSIRDYEKNNYGKIKDFSKIKNINILRNEIFLDAERKLIENLESDIFYLEAPTGSGKSNCATNLSFTLIKQDKTKNKIIYVYPFNTLVEQNINSLQKVFENEKDIFNKIAVINSVEPIKTNDNEEELSCIEYYTKALLNREFLNYPMILTTHVTMFNYLFGVSKENNFPLHQIANSVIVLDEIQSYKNIIWGEIITFLTSYAKLLNIKIIIMSATLPNLDKLTLSKGKTVRLIENRGKYFENPLFKNRVRVDYQLLESDNIIEDLYSHVKTMSKYGKKILIEFICKNSAYAFYNKLKEDKEIMLEVELMSGDDNIGERDRIINRVKNTSSIILVATQVIEAGVDIDMDIGYKNISMLDSEEQFLGRINRSCKKENCIVYFFKIDDVKDVYRIEDVRKNKDITIEDEKIRDILEHKKFDEFYQLVIERLDKITSGFNELNINDFFSNKVGRLEFKDIEERLRLISLQDNKISVYLSSMLTVKDEELDGEKIWHEYKHLLEDTTLNYAQRKVQLSEIRSKMNNFIYEIRYKYGFVYNERIGDLFFIENGEEYFKDGKLDKDRFINQIGEFI
jgi:CRISPR-associated endonuclease/helicase Cas3